MQGSKEGGAADTWLVANQRYMMAELDALSCLLQPDAGEEAAAAARRAVDEAAAAMPAPPAIDDLTALFGLSPFERDLVLLCAGVELQSALAARCAAAQRDPRRQNATFSLALAVLPGAHWSALGPGAPLRRFHLVELVAGESLTQSPLRIEERVLHYLVGIEHPDERLLGILEPAAQDGVLVPSHRRVAERLAALWTRAAAGQARPIVALCGADPASRLGVAAAACAAMRLRLDVLAAGVVAARPDAELAGGLLAREVILRRGALLIEADDLDEAAAARVGLLTRRLERLSAPLVVSARHPVRLGRRPAMTLEVPRPAAAEQRALFREALVEIGAGAPAAASGETDALDPAGADALLDPIVAQFDLNAPAIRAACAAALGGGPGGDAGAALWEACRVETRQDLDELAQRVEPAATWDDLVLPEAVRRSLREIAASIRQRAKVHGAWGFTERGARGVGVGALFAGASGTGKTMAAEVLASDLRLDLYRIDLSQLVSKYIGETEKNLRRVFDVADRGAAILLFDEADALFGRRGEVRDSIDRYANLEIAYLLQRMEAYRGLAILTTNLEHALDPAFLRRLRFVVRFPLPGAAERAAIWRRALPPQAPTEGLDVERLAQMGLTGGNIRNVALRAAFLAAEAGAPVRMEHVVEAARAEYEKLGRAPRADFTST